MSYGTPGDLAKSVNKNKKCISCAHKKIDLLTLEGLRKCSKCGVTKPLDDFNRSSRDVSKKTGYCRPCSNALGREYYRKNKGNLKKKEVRRHGEIKETVNNLKKVPCADCGGMFPTVCMDFDHLPQFEKSANVAELLRRKASLEKILEEVAKCEVVCANCHRIRTSERFIQTRKEIEDALDDTNTEVPA